MLLNFIYIVYKDARPLYNLGTVGANSCLTRVFTVCVSGYRSVQLRNGFSEEMEITSLLVHIDFRNPKVHWLTMVVYCNVM